MSDWDGPLFDASCTLDELDAIIDEQVALDVERWRDRLDADDELTDAERDRLVAFATPRIQQAMRVMLTTGWHRLRAEAGLPSAHVH